MSLWPMFAARALDAGIESMLAFRLFVCEETLGALDLYSRQRGAFDESARAFGTVFAAHAALALAGAEVHAHDLTVAEGLQEALITRVSSGRRRGYSWRHGTLTPTLHSTSYARCPNVRI